MKSCRESIDKIGESLDKRCVQEHPCNTNTTTRAWSRLVLFPPCSTHIFYFILLTLDLFCQVPACPKRCFQPSQIHEYFRGRYETARYQLTVIFPASNFLTNEDSKACRPTNCDTLCMCSTSLLFIPLILTFQPERYHHYLMNGWEEPYTFSVTVSDMHQSSNSSDNRKQSVLLCVHFFLPYCQKGSHVQCLFPRWNTNSSKSGIKELSRPLGHSETLSKSLNLSALAFPQV